MHSNKGGRIRECRLIINYVGNSYSHRILHEVFIHAMFHKVVNIHFTKSKEKKHPTILACMTGVWNHSFSILF